MPDKITAWRAADGSLFESEDAAKSHDFREAFWAWARENFSAGATAEVDPLVAKFIDKIVEHRAKVHDIFRLLNGGVPLVAPPRPPASPEPEKIADYRTCPD